MVYIKGEENVGILEGKNPTEPVSRVSSKNDTSSRVDTFYLILDDPELLDCYLNLPDLEETEHYPLNYTWIQQEQQNEKRFEPNGVAGMLPTTVHHAKAIGYQNIICYMPCKTW